MTVSSNAPAQPDFSGPQPTRHPDEGRADQPRLDSEPVPMQLQTTPPTSPREPEAKQIDYNDSIRSTFFSMEDLRQCGEDLAAKGVSSLPGFFPFEFRPRHRENENEILRVYRATAADVEAGATITPAAEWLLDNHHVVEEAIQEVRRDFPRRFYRQLPTISVSGTVIPRTMALAWLYAAHTHSTVTRESITAMVEGFQKHETFKIGELWALPSILRFVLIENLRRIAIRVERSRGMRRKANDVADQIIRLSDPEKSRTLLAESEALAADNTFVAQLLYRMRDGSQTSGAVIGWIEDQLEKRGSDVESALVAEQNRLSSGNATMSNIIRSLREIDDTDWAVWFESVSKIDAALREGSDYAALDFGSRNKYRDTIEKLARRSGHSEFEVTQIAIQMVREAEVAAETEAPLQQPNVGSFLVGKQRKLLEKKISYRPSVLQTIIRLSRRLDWFAIAGPNILLTILAMFAVYSFVSPMAIPSGAKLIMLLLFALPASEGAMGLFNTLVTLFVKPSRLVGYEFLDGIPEDARTLVAVPCLISKRDHVDELVRNLEVHYLANPRGEIYFALVSDWADSKDEESSTDADVLDYAKREIAQLSARYAYDGKTRFYLLHRRRLYNEQEGVWMGWERKRGKLHELNMLLRGDRDTSFLQGANTVPDNVQYVMTLDSDTRLMRDAVTKLVGKMYHPINRPVVDPKTQNVIAGYSLLQPRVTPSLTTGSEASAFQRIFSSNRGIDPYVFTVSDVYQDIAGEGSFTGKGLYHVDAFEAALKGRIQENAVLSHDLLEGSYVRCALVTDVELVEDFPTRYEVEMSRQHRWARGDWQLLPYIFNLSNGLSMLGRWKMYDNLRRSLIPLAWLVASVMGWYYMEPTEALIWQIVLIFSLFVAPTLSLINGLLPRRNDIVARAHLHAVLNEVRAANAQVALRIVFIAHNAAMMGDAIVRSLYRTFVSGKLMLEWRTAAQVQSAGHGTIGDYYRAMWVAPALSAISLALAAISDTGLPFIGIPFALLWALSPAVAWFVSQSAETEDQLVVSDEAIDEMRLIARRTWRYFETFVTAEQHFLPPDNFQETPQPVLAERTSPTNIGVYLLSVMSARDFGWIGFEETINRLEQTIATIDRMPKYRGHLFNWYRTNTLETMEPRYISSVDSGNLAGHLIAVSSMCRDWAEAPSAHVQGSLTGIGDVAAILQEVLRDLPDDRKTVRPLRRLIEERIVGFQNALAAIMREHEFASIRVINLAVLARDMHKLTVNLDHEVRTPQSSEVTKWANSLVTTCEAHIADGVFDLGAIESLRQRLLVMKDRARDIAFSMDFGFLFRPERRLLSIGFRVNANELDEACYDLLASEARLTSLFAIAKGDLPTEHWYKLGRPIVPIGARGALISWSGSMFEYLMPPLVMQERQGGILNQTNNLVVKEQINHGRRLGTPWGISEAAFNARDHELTYQYTNFGVPTLGLKRGLGQNAVIAPYASILACMYDPKSALANLGRLREVGALGAYGYHDAVDFTPTRVPEGQKCAVVRNYYAHHHGMSIAAVANVVFNGRLREWFHADPVIEAAELLLQEKAPRDIPIMNAKREPESVGKGQDDLLRPEVRIIENPLSQDRETVFLSNGHYSVMLTANGAGYARWNGQSVTRWKPDPVEDRTGTFIFLRDTTTGDWWSATSEPRRAAGEKMLTRFGDDKAEFVKTVGDLTSEVECIVATEHDAEGRRVMLLNTGTQDRFIEVTSYAEPVLSTDEADSAHPAFSKMFLRTEISRRGDVIRVSRNKRSSGDPDMEVAHLVTDNAGSDRHTEAETDRRRFIGPGRTLAEAAAFDTDAVLSGTDGFTLDPIMSLRRVVRVPAGKKVSVVFWTIAAPSREEVDRAIDRYRHPETFNQELIHAWTRSQVQMRHVGVTSQEAASFQMLGRYLVYPDMHLRADSATVQAGLDSQSKLWPLAISGDYPIFCLRINDDGDLGIAREALRAQEYLRARGITADLVIINERASSYAQDMQHALDSMCENLRLRGLSDGPRQHIFSVRRDLMEAETWSTLLSASRAVFHARNGTISDQIARANSLYSPAPVKGSEKSAEFSGPLLAAPQEDADAAPAEIKGDGLSFWNAFGGFADGGREYVVRLRGGEATPQPWINVISNDAFGFHISAEGAAYSWSRNSRDYQLTPWTNDTVVNRPGEAIFIRDMTSGTVATPYAALSRRRSVVFETAHGLGYSIFRSTQDDLEIEVVQTVHRNLPAKLVRVSVRNRAASARQLRLYGYNEWVLGNNRARSAPFVLSKWDETAEALVATNPYSIDFAGRSAFFAVDGGDAAGYTASRREFLGAIGGILAPQAVTSGADLSGSVDVDGDPCAVVATDISIEPGAERQVTFILGDTDTDDQVRAIIGELRETAFDTVLEANKTFWREFTDIVKVETPDPAFNAMINNWLPYQSLGCRIMARSAFYQASGAFGFRDQLQDTLAFLIHRPELARAQILNAASRQFTEGDVQHWWLPGTGAGVRTMISDDVVWLAHAVTRYCTVTGTSDLLAEKLAFITGPALEAGQHDAFYKPEISEEVGDVYEHCARALDLAIKRTGENGLPLFLAGDWNDGMNRVGEKGQGTSTWLGWFLAGTLRGFLPFARERKDEARITRWEAHLEALKKALATAGWDGDYYRRGYYDDGTPLGTSEALECRIDSIAQSWSVLSGEGDEQRSLKAMDAVMAELVDPDQRIVRLFTPPLERTSQDPGYIKAYPPGVRENGGQYTHAATWVALAFAEQGRAEEAWRVFQMLNPISHAENREAAEHYRVEPYVVAADIYGEGDLAGRGGWTWYTGSAGWLYRVGVEGILGIRRQGDRLVIRPVLPAAWNGYSAEVTLNGARHKISVERDKKSGEPIVSVNNSVTKNAHEGILL
ncbi:MULTISPECIES: cyclic beta-(1,2)-glucan synthase [Ensifer]|jgi:cyclic beta-1,2-glucan synthetase|uniref:cyclic beta-(1,2)-glucan synthase n=1 Tax=Ensifer TaxID=106591 RepID=UPI00088F4D7C|nr:MULTISPECIES: cyclic beta-(1,2)-glucan synthase [Ensifer]MBD9593298.1 protein ndvB [Ensifer sp. ENS05]SDL86988.1 cyclic beta-1,2-glucan synthetase [Ensifer sp. YR511]